MSIFKKEDKVYHPSTGWGVVEYVSTLMDGSNVYYVSASIGRSRWICEDELSFTEYKIETEKKGFSQKRPVPPSIKDEIEKEIMSRRGWSTGFQSCWTVLISKEDFEKLNEELDKGIENATAYVTTCENKKLDTKITICNGLIEYAIYPSDLKSSKMVIAQSNIEITSTSSL